MIEAVRLAQKKQSKIRALMIFVCLGLLTTSCIEQAQSRRGGSGLGSPMANTQETVSANYGRVLAANPTILSGGIANEHTDLSTLITRSPVYITNNSYLTKTCSLIGDCLEVTENSGVSAFENESRRWAFPVTTTEFLQVNAYYHVSKVMEEYINDVKNYSYTVLNQAAYKTAIPLSTDIQKAFWTGSNHSSLTVHADSSLKNNASFDPNNFLMSLGYVQGYKNIKMAQDASVIYHEFGHTVVDRLINHRNRSFNVENCIDNPSPICIGESRLGYFAHDEGLALNEGVADYFSYFTNDRTHMGEWGLGKFVNASRPVSEDDDTHISGISTDTDARITYPDYLGYDVNNSDNSKSNDVHVDGQIISHFLVALTRELETYCTADIQSAKKIVFYNLSETLAELGDLSATGRDPQGSDTSTTVKNQINLDIDYASEWIKSVNPINYRRFTQAFARNVYKTTISTQQALCPLASYSQNKLEQLLDSYGLLLFRSYNNNYNTYAEILRPVNQLNRKKTELINKNLMIKDTRSAYSAISVFDIRSSIYTSIQNQIDQSEVVTTDARYNNGNGVVSPGEIVGIHASVYNNSNSVMAGARVIASDWAHMQDGVPCSNLSDNFPTIAQGGKSCDTLTQGNYKDEGRIMPVCMLTYNDGTSSKLLNQHEFLKKMKSDIGLLEKDCLGQGETRTQDELNNCFVKALPSANTANIPFIAPKSNWQETMKDETGQPVFNDSNIMFFEINKNLPLGTEVTCRLRMSFSNCEECYHDLETQYTTNEFGAGQSYYDDYKDFEFAGERPFNILKINFTIGQ